MAVLEPLAGHLGGWVPGDARRADPSRHGPRAAALAPSPHAPPPAEEVYVSVLQMLGASYHTLLSEAEAEATQPAINDDDAADTQIVVDAAEHGYAYAGRRAKERPWEAEMRWAAEGVVEAHARLLSTQQGYQARNVKKLRAELAYALQVLN